MKKYLKITITIIIITISLPLSFAFSQSLPLKDKIVRELTLKTSLLLTISPRPKDVSTNESTNNLILCFKESDYFRGIIDLAIKHPQVPIDWEIKENVPLKATKNCHILFLDLDREKTIAYVKDYPVLT